MKRLFLISIFLGVQVLSFAQYNHTQLYANGNIVEQGQYNADPGITSTDSKETIAKKLAVVHKIGTWKYQYENGSLVAEEYYSNAGISIGVWKNWHVNGKLSSEINRTTGMATYYHQNGSKAEEGIINAAGQHTGNWKGWHENGKVNYVGTWTSTGLKTGTWKYNDTNEQLFGTEIWNNGVLVH